MKSLSLGGLIFFSWKSISTRTNDMATKWISVIQVEDTTKLIGSPKRFWLRLWNMMMPYNLTNILFWMTTKKFKVLNRTVTKKVIVLVKKSYEAAPVQFDKTCWFDLHGVAPCLLTSLYCFMLAPIFSYLVWQLK